MTRYTSQAICRSDDLRLKQSRTVNGLTTPSASIEHRRLFHTTADDASYLEMPFLIPPTQLLDEKLVDRPDGCERNVYRRRANPAPNHPYPADPRPSHQV